MIRYITALLMLYGNIIVTNYKKNYMQCSIVVMVEGLYVIFVELMPFCFHLLLKYDMIGGSKE